MMTNSRFYFADPAIFSLIICSLLIFLLHSSAYSQSKKEENQLIINSIPDGASVYIDDNYSGNTPFTLPDVTRQGLKVKVKLNDVTREQTVGLVMGKYELFFIMDGDYGLLNVQTSPQSGDIIIDDTLSCGITPLFDKKLPLGNHKLIVKNENYDLIEKQIQVKPTRYNYNFKLEKKFSFISMPDSSKTGNLKIDGKIIGKNKDLQYKIEKGSRTLELFPSDYHRPIRDNFDIEGDKHYELKVNYNYLTAKYVLMSAFIPGLGQIWDKSQIKGAAYLAGTLLCGALYYKANEDHNFKMIGYNEDYDKYLKAWTESQANDARARLDSEINDLNNANKRKTIFLNAAIGIYILNLVDALIFHSKGADLELHKVVELNADNNRLGLKININ